jgi:methanogenic corrinoid protein MtbC1
LRADRWTNPVDGGLAQGAAAPRDAESAGELLEARALVAHFTQRLLSADGEDDHRSAIVAQLRAGGWTLEAVVADLFVPSARLLGDYWLDDSASFVDVTIAMHRLTVQFFELDRAQPMPRPAHGGVVLLAPAPADQHGFGLAVLGFFLRRAGWNVIADVPGDARAVIDCARSTRLDAIGFSVGHDRSAPALATLIAAVREASRNQGVLIGVGGPAVLRDASLATRVGADFFAETPQELIALLDKVPHRPLV